MSNLFYAKATTKELIVKLEFSNKLALSKYLASHQDEGYKGLYRVTIEKDVEKRSLDQNAYLWGVVYKTISDYNGDTLEDLHEHFVRHLLPPKFIKVMGKEIKIPSSTTELNKVEFGEYIERIRAEVAPMGIVIPEADNKKEFNIESIYPENDLGEPLI